MHHTPARLAQDHPKETDYIVNLLVTILTAIIGSSFSRSIGIFAQNWVASAPKDREILFQISFFGALANRSFVWSLLSSKIRHYLFASHGRPVSVLVVVLYIIIFANIPAGLTTLLHPYSFHRNITFNVKELDFSSNSSQCLDWYNANIIPTDCSWKPAPFSNVSYTTCLVENQVMDVLESGRGKLFELDTDTNRTTTYNQLRGLRFAGSIRGVLPNGPHGLPGMFDPKTVFPSQASSSRTYNYTLNLQGFSSDVSCVNDTATPITISENPSMQGWNQINGSCPSGQDIVHSSYTVPQSEHTLSIWACKSTMTGDGHPPFTIYLRGDDSPGYTPIYRDTVGNMTCTISSAQPVYPVLYDGHIRLFTVQNSISLSPASLTELAPRTVASLQELVQQTQFQILNVVAASVSTFAETYYGLDVLSRDPKFLTFYERMIQGILEYQATYIRLVYSLNDPPPPRSCMRDAHGEVQYLVYGWQPLSGEFYFLIAITLANLTSFLVLIAAAQIPCKLPSFNPTDPTSLVIASTVGVTDSSSAEGLDPSITHIVYDLKDSENLTSNTYTLQVRNPPDVDVQPAS